jgi:hypothetical protein
LIEQWLAQANEALETEREADENGHAAMNEFEWERFLKESDERTAKYGRLLDLFMDHPDRDRMVAKEMGWELLAEELEAEEKRETAGITEEPDDSEDFSDLPGIEPDPATEGVDWIRREDGRICHPLCARAHDAGLAAHKELTALGLLSETGGGPAQEFIFNLHCLAAKLAGALNCIAFDGRDPDGGFVVAQLKRALQFFTGAMAALQELEEKHGLAPEVTGRHRSELFAVREKMTRIMDDYRKNA